MTHRRAIVLALCALACTAVCAGPCGAAEPAGAGVVVHEGLIYSQVDPPPEAARSRATGGNDVRPRAQEGTLSRP